MVRDGKRRPTCFCGSFDHVPEEHEKYEGTKLPEIFMSAERAGPLTTELDLHGKFPDEVEAPVDQFLAANYQAGTSSVTIIYGIGAGKLRAATLDYLRRHPMVKKITKINDGSSEVTLNY